MSDIASLAKLLTKLPLELFTYSALVRTTGFDMTLEIPHISKLKSLKSQIVVWLHKSWKVWKISTRDTSDMSQWYLLIHRNGRIVVRAAHA